MPNLPRNLWKIAAEQDAIGWTHFTEGRATKRIKSMQTYYMCNRNVTYTADHWMKDLIRKLMGLSHEMWLARNLMKQHSMQGASAIRTIEELKEEVDKAHHHDYQNIKEKDR